jgi:hypothetical protein
MGRRATVQSSFSLSSPFVSRDEISKAYNELSPKYGGKRNQYFGVIFISKQFKIPLNLAASFINFQDSDPYGVDGFFHDLADRTLFLFVFRWSSDHLSFKNALENIGNGGLFKIFNPLKFSEESPMITSLKICLSENWKTIDRIILNLIFNGDPVLAEESKVLSFLRESAEDKKNLIDDYFTSLYQGAIGVNGDNRRSCEFAFRYTSNQRVFGHATSSRQIAEYTIAFADTVKEVSGQNELTVGFIPLWT